MGNVAFAPGAGDDEFVSIAQEAAVAAQAAEAAAVAAQAAAEAAQAATETALANTPYDIALFIDGAPGATQDLLKFVANRDFYLPASLTGSVAEASVAATANYAIDVQKNGGSIGTINWAPAGTVATFVFAVNVQFNSGDNLALIAAGVPDATLLDIQVTLSGQLGTP